MLNAPAIRIASRLGLLGRHFSAETPQPPRGWVPTPYVTETVVRAQAAHLESIVTHFQKGADHAREAVGEHVNAQGPP